MSYNFRRLSNYYIFSKNIFFWIFELVFEKKKFVNCFGLKLLELELKLNKIDEIWEIQFDL
jgi:hypothetical protein